MVDNPDVDREPGIENNIIQSQPLKARDNIYNDYRETPSTKMVKSDTSSIRSPSSLANTHTTKFGSQGSIRSAISAKESTISPYPDGASSKNGGTNSKYSERSVDSESSKGGRHFDDSKSLLARQKSKDSIIAASTIDKKTPVPAHRRNLSKTHLIDGIPQTEV